jgi:1,4-alpha-glucan branching enzyme
MWTHPGKKLLFMGGEVGQRREWQHEESLEWHVLGYPLHAGVQRWVRDLNRLYRSTPALHQLDFSEAGFQWIDCDDADVSVISFLRRGAAGELALVACNFTPVPREAYRIGVPRGGRWRERLNSDAAEYGGSGQGNLGALEAVFRAAHGHDHSLDVRLPPLAVLVLTPDLATQHPATG